MSTIIQVMQNFKNLFWLKKKEVINFYKQSNFKIRVVSFLSSIFLILFFFGKSLNLPQYFKESFYSESIKFNSSINILLFIVFCIHIIAIFIWGTTSDEQTTINKIIRYPISIKQIIFFRTIIIIREFTNIIFLPLYILFFFIVNDKLNINGILAFLLIFLLFLYFFNSLIELLRNIVSAIVSINKFKINYNVFFFLGMLFLLHFIQKVPYFFTDEGNLKLLNKFLLILPTGILTKSIFLISEKMDIKSFVLYIFYFAFISFLIFIANLHIVKSNITRNLGKASLKPKLKESLLAKLFGFSFFNPFSIKTIIYYSRIPRNLFNVIGFLLYEIWTAYFITVNFSELSNNDKYIGLSFLSLYQVLVIIVNNANFFSFDSSAVINYFFRPIKINTLIRSKTIVVNFFTILNVICLFYFAFILKLNILEFFYQLNFLILEYFLVLFISILTSIYLPKAIDYYSIWGMNYPLTTGIIGFALSLLLIVLNYYLLLVINLSFGGFLLMIVFLINLIITFSLNKTFYFVNKLLIKQSKLIIKVLR